MILTEKQKQIYNLYLRAFRINNNQPFKPKKNFSDIETNAEKLTSLQKIEKVFCKYPAFFNKIYFDAPYKIYNDEKKYYSLKFYGSQKGISTCIAYYKVLLQSNPEEQFEFLKDSYKFIGRYCEEKHIPLELYSSYCSVSQNDCLLHLKEHKISWYVIFSLPGFYELIHNLPHDEFELYYGSDISIDSLYNKYKSSFKTQEFLSDIKRKITIYLQKKLAEQPK